MQATAVSREDRGLRFAGVAIALLVSADVCIRVAKHWPSYGWYDRVYAILVVVTLATWPWLRNRVRRSSTGEWIFSYLLIILVLGLPR